MLDLIGLVWIVGRQPDLDPNWEAPAILVEVVAGDLPIFFILETAQRPEKMPPEGGEAKGGKALTDGAGSGELGITHY